MHDRASVAALRDSLAAVAELPSAPLGAEQRGRIKNQVCDVVVDLHAAGWQAERVIVAVKEIAQEAGLRTNRSIVLSHQQSLDGQDALIVDLVRWCMTNTTGAMRRTRGESDAAMKRTELFSKRSW